MGWSQSDLAHRLNCNKEEITDWEQNPAAVILHDRIEHLMLLEKQADFQAQSVLQGALADLVLDETYAEQIPQDVVRQRFLT